jgi:hypothetical protein
MPRYINTTASEPIDFHTNSLFPDNKKQSKKWLTGLLLL